MWTVKKIMESDYGCEERMPGESATLLVYLESDEGYEEQLEVAENWIVAQEIEEGDEWPEEIEVPGGHGMSVSIHDESVMKQQSFMDNYMDALDEMEDNQ